MAGGQREGSLERRTVDGGAVNVVGGEFDILPSRGKGWVSGAGARAKDHKRRGEKK